MTFLVSALAAGAMFFAALVPPVVIPSGTEDNEPTFPAPPGYLLPWPGGQIEHVTQGEETTFTHNGAAAYAFDFGMDYDTVVASRSGRVSMVREDSNSGGCSAIYNASANYVVIDHGDGTSALYLHLAYDSVTVEMGQDVKQGDPIAISGETGLTCNADDSGPAPHLHFQVQRTEDGQYFTQSLPVAFDDISDNEGVPLENEYYVSGNFGEGQPQKIKLTPRRVARVFNPVARAANPDLVEAVPAPSPTPAPGEPPPPGEQPLAGGADTATAEPPTPTQTPAPDVEDTPVPTGTPRPADTDTPEPAATDTPVPADTPSPAPSDTPPPADTATAADATEEPTTAP